MKSTDNSIPLFDPQRDLGAPGVRVEEFGGAILYVGHKDPLIARGISS
jgi:hypothetical protein